MDVEIVEYGDDSDMKIVEILFREYQKDINIDLCFQNFESELKELPGKYQPSKGGVILILEGLKKKEKRSTIGCVCLRKQEEGICEMKRLYIRKEFRQKGYGKLLVGDIIERAKKMGYSKMRLDTLKTMKNALHLYKNVFGFYEIEAYIHNPLQAVYLELDLQGRKEV